MYISSFQKKFYSIKLFDSELFGQSNIIHYVRLTVVHLFNYESFEYAGSFMLFLTLIETYG